MNDPYNPANIRTRDLSLSMTKGAEVEINLFSIKERRSIYILNITTTLGAVGDKDKYGGETYINLGSIKTAVLIALDKGAKRTLKKCKE